MKMTFNILTTGLVLGLLACGDESSASETLSSDAAIERAEGVVAGDAQNAQKEGELYVVEVAMENGATVTVELNAETGDLVELEDKQGPFDYEIKPGMGFVTYGKARDLALAEAGEKVVAWNLRAASSTSADSDSEDEESSAASEDFRYEFYVREGDKLWEVKLDATTGKIQSVASSLTSQRLSPSRT